MLGELVQLNGRRHRTYFLLGFRDSVFERERQESLAAQNEERLRWYLAGYVCGLARRERWGAITEVFETEPALRTLGAAADGPAAVGGDVVFRALAHQGRYPEAGTFAKIEAVRRSTRLRSEMLRVAILLLRRGRASDARLMLETLTRYLAELPADDRDTGRFAAEVARRRALCLRLLGLSDEAMELLLDLRNSTDPETASISETELGLVAGGFRRLGEMIIPSDESDRSIFRQRLEKGEENYLAATTSSTFRSSHANFALGVLDLVRGDSREAADRIEAALTHFSGNPEVYSFDGSLSLAQLYLGVAHCHALEEGSDVARAASLILEGLSGGARMPVWMIGDTVEGMALYYPDDAMQVLEALAASKNTEVVNSLLGLSIAGRSGVLQSELLRRTEDERRSLTDRCSDAHRLLPWLLAVGRSSEAARVLDFMEDCASKGIETERYLSMMQSPDSYSPALDVDDADESCARVLLACGRRDESASALVKLGWRLLASGEAADLEYGSIVLGHIDAIGADAALSGAQLRTALEARWKEDEAEDVSHATPSSSVYDVRILVVGGNEAQERMDESIIRAVADELPGVSVEFLHTGWASNWITFAEEFVRRQGKVDGVVVMTMIRTQLGRRIRGDCQVPWRGTRARGMGGIVEAIRRVVPAARAHLARAHHSRSAR